MSRQTGQMKIDLSSIDTNSFMVHQHELFGEMVDYVYDMERV